MIFLSWGGYERADQHQKQTAGGKEQQHAPEHADKQLGLFGQHQSTPVCMYEMMQHQLQWKCNAAQI